MIILFMPASSPSPSLIGFQFAVFLHVQVDHAAVEGVERPNLYSVAPAADSVGGGERLS